MKGIIRCPCPCKHTFIAEMHRHEHGSAVALLWTAVPAERRTLLERWLSSDLRGVVATDSTLHKQLMPATPDRVFAAMLTEFKALDVVIAKQTGDVPSYRQYLEGDKGNPPNVLFMLNVPQAEQVLFYAGGMDAECKNCGSFTSMTVSSLLIDQRLCKKCKEKDLIIENEVEAHEIKGATVA